MDRKGNASRSLFEDLSKIIINRCILVQGTVITKKLHVFCDSSEKAYAAAVYSRTMNESGEVHVELLAAKSKVSPIKSLSLPRLELCAAQLGARLMSACISALS